MLVKSNGRPMRIMKSVKGGIGEVMLHDITTPETLPKNMRVLTYVTLKTGESVGKHIHDDESELYHCIDGEGTVVIDGRKFNINQGDTVITSSGQEHSIKNTGLSDLVVLAVVVHD
jgi:quercetin dioxygenase-like cupin family protein